jgi:IS4 transposase
MDLSSGVLVELYRRRWEIEKVFDDLKNKLKKNHGAVISLPNEAKGNSLL